MEITIIGIIASAVALIGILLCLFIIIMTFIQSRETHEAVRHVDEKVEIIDPAKAIAAAEAIVVAKRLVDDANAEKKRIIDDTNAEMRRLAEHKDESK